MRMIFKVSYYVRSNYENKQGKSPLMIRIFLNGEMLNVGPSGIYIDKKLWNNSTNRIIYYSIIKKMRKKIHLFATKELIILYLKGQLMTSLIRVKQKEIN